MSLVKINLGENTIAYRGQEVKAYLEKINRNKLTELANKILDKIFKQLNYRINDDISIIYITNLAYVEKGYCPGVTHRLKSFDKELKSLKDIVTYLNDIEYRYSCDNYFGINIR